jgi:AcrR family transcriptional regulator
MRVFWEHGFEGTRVSDLTQAMGLNAPSLYATFGSKEELFREAVAYYNAPERSLTTIALHRLGPIRDVVEAMLRNNAREYADPATPPGCLVVLAGIAYSTESAMLRDLLKSCRDEDRERLVGRIRSSIASGELPSGLDGERLASFMMTVLYGLSIRAREARRSMNSSRRSTSRCGPGTTPLRRVDNTYQCTPGTSRSARLIGLVTGLSTRIVLTPRAGRCGRRDGARLTEGSPGANPRAAAESG